jgi:hypothetical protein
MIEAEQCLLLPAKPEECDTQMAVGGGDVGIALKSQAYPVFGRGELTALQRDNAEQIIGAIMQRNQRQHLMAAALGRVEVSTPVVSSRFIEQSNR